MKKKAVVIAMAAALAVSQYAAVFAANSPGTGVMIPNEDSDGDYDIGERVDQVTGGSSSASGTGNSSAATPGGQTAAQITVPTESGTASQSGGQAVVGDTGIEFVQGSESAVSGLPETVVSTINAINTGTGLAEAGTGLDLSGYNAPGRNHRSYDLSGRNQSGKNRSYQYACVCPKSGRGSGNRTGALLQQHDFQVGADHAYICGCGKEDDPCDHPELGNIFGYL